MTGQQFLAGVWCRVRQLEGQQDELARAKEKNRQLRRTAVKRAAMVLCVFAGVLAVLLVVQRLLLLSPPGGLSGILFVALAAVFAAEMLSAPHGKNKKEAGSQ